jgi:hypothetical protein
MEVLMYVLGLLACGDVSNALFEEDALFLAALPAEGEHTMSVEGDDGVAARALGDRAEQRSTSIEVAAGVNGPVLALLHGLDGVRSLPPSSRSENGRTWGPYQVDDAELTVEMSRPRDGEYDYALTATRDGETAEILAGTHYAGATVATGDGAFTFDGGRASAWFGDGAWSGVLTVDYDLRSGQDLLVDIEGVTTAGGETVDAEYSFHREGGAGELQFHVPADVPDDGSDELVDIVMVTRWVDDEGGRADGTYTGGGLAGRTWNWAQCWAPGGGLVYEDDNLGIVEGMGDVADCVYEEAAEAGRV